MTTDTALDAGARDSASPASRSASASNADSVTLILSCADQPGIVAAVSTFIFDHGLNILEAQQFDDIETSRFFMRVVANRSAAAEIDVDDLRKGFASLAEKFSMTWELSQRARKMRVMILLSSYDHCLADLLYLWRIGELPMDISAVVSNHPREAHKNIDWHGLSYVHLPVSADTRATQEEKIWELVNSTRTDLVVLARYMQILSDSLALKLAGRCINIHHSFLPGFKGARPYHQAYQRGVKLIGATAHYVTPDLDEGPIIEQDVERVTHQARPETLLSKGRDIERRVLSRAVRWHLERRVLLNGSRTVVFA